MVSIRQRVLETAAHVKEINVPGCGSLEDMINVDADSQALIWGRSRLPAEVHVTRGFHRAPAHDSPRNYYVRVGNRIKILASTAGIDIWRRCARPGCDAEKQGRGREEQLRVTPSYLGLKHLQVVAFLPMAGLYHGGCAVSSPRV
jgi:hypothetical protein